MTGMTCRPRPRSGADRVDASTAEPPLVRCVTYDYGHHASASGYGRLVEHVGGAWRPSGFTHLLGESILRMPAKYLALRCGLFEYSRQSFTAELDIALKSLTARAGVWHHLYAEKSFLWTGRIGRVRGHRQVGTFHHHPVKFPRMVARTGHYRHLDHAIAVSTAQVELLEEIVGSDRVTVVPHGVDIDYWYPPASRRESGRRSLIFAGNHMRDFVVLDRVVSRVLEQRDDVEFVLMSSELQCAPIAHRKGVRWLTRVPDDLYRAEMRSAEMLVLPLLYSTAVNTVLEALGCGVPVVTTRGGISDYLDNRCAVQIEPGDADAMTDAILTLLDDERRLERMRSCARQKAEQFSWPRVAEQFQTIYQQVVSSDKREIDRGTRY